MPNYNEDKLRVVGTFTGVIDTDFFVKITAADGTTFQWKSKPAGGVYSSVTNVSSYSLDTPITLGLVGVQIELTASAKADYNNGDIWTFTAYANLKVSETTSAFTDMGIIEHADRKDIIVISKSSGDVGIIEDYESETPKKSDIRFNIGSSDSIDIQNKNKELYVATGRNNNPKWCGYVKHHGLNGSIAEPEFVVQEAMDSIEAADAIEADAFSDFVVMESGGVGGGAAKLIVGIKDEDNYLYIMNIDDDKLFRFECLSKPLRIRPDYAQRNTDITTVQGELKGVAVLCAGQHISGKNYINSIEYWSMNAGTVEGEDANKDKTIHLVAPEQQGMRRFTDFLIVPTQYNATSHYSGGDFVLVVSTSTDSATGTLTYPLFKYANVDALTNGDEIDSDEYTPISPKISYEGEDGAAGSFVYLKKDEVEYNSAHEVEAGNGMDNEWKYVADCNLVFGCHDGTATTTINPTVMFTAQLGEAKQFTEEEDAGATYYYGPVFQDTTASDAKAYWIVNWATFNIPIDATGVAQQPMLMHIRDNISNGADSLQAWRDYPGGSPFEVTDWLGGAICNFYMPPANNPNCGNNRKFIVAGTSQGTAPGRRGWVIYIDAGSRRVRTFFTPIHSTYEHTQWILTTIPHVFPNKATWVYTKYGDATSISSEYDDPPGKTSFFLGPGNWRDGRRWRLGDYPFIVGPGAQTGPKMPSNLLERIHVMSPLDSEYSDSTVRRYVSSIVGKVDSNAWIDEDSTPTNLLGSLTDWLTFTSPAKTSGDNWVGSDTVKKVFYRAAIVYDGYQESNLMGLDVSFADGGSVMTKPITFDIKIDAEYTLPRRVKSVVLYRADSVLETDTEPDGLYRFVKEIDLVQFNWNSSTQLWEYTIIDSGYSEGSYGSINGVSEEIHSLPINYSISTEQNGYLFVGNCNHTQFEDSENFLFRSQPGKFSIFDWSKDFLQLPFVPTALAGFMGKVYVFGASQMAVINPESLYIEDTLKGVGCMGQKSVYSTSFGLFWADKTNLYLASPQIKKVGTPILEADSHGWLGLSNSVKESSVIGYDSRRKSYLVFFTNGDNRCWAYNTQDNRWDLWATPGEVMDSAYTSDGHSLLLLSDGTICKYLSGPNKRDWEFVSKKMTLGSDTQDKKLRNVKLDASSRTGTTLYYKVDGTGWQSGTDVSTISSGDENTIKKVIAADNKNHWIQIKATGNNDTAASDIKAYSMGVVYKPKSVK